MDEKHVAAAIANRALRALRARNLDCVRGGSDDVSQQIHTAILHAARDQLKNHQRRWDGLFWRAVCLGVFFYALTMGLIALWQAS